MPMSTLCRLSREFDRFNWLAISLDFFLVSGIALPPSEIGMEATGVLGLIGPSLVGVLALLLMVGRLIRDDVAEDTGNDIILALVGNTGEG